MPPIYTNLFNSDFEDYLLPFEREESQSYLPEGLFDMFGASTSQSSEGATHSYYSDEWFPTLSAPYSEPSITTEDILPATQPKRVHFSEETRSIDREEGAEITAEAKRQRRAVLLLDRQNRLAAVVGKLQEAPIAPALSKLAFAIIGAAMTLSEWPHAGKLLKWLPFSEDHAIDRLCESTEACYEQLLSEINDFWLYTERVRALQQEAWAPSTAVGERACEALLEYENLEALQGDICFLAADIDRERAQSENAPLMHFRLEEGCLLSRARILAESAVIKKNQAFHRAQFSEVVDALYDSLRPQHPSAHPDLPRTLAAICLRAASENLFSAAFDLLAALLGHSDSKYLRLEDQIEEIVITGSKNTHAQNRLGCRYIPRFQTNTPEIKELNAHTIRSIVTLFFPVRRGVKNQNLFYSCIYNLLILDSEVIYPVKEQIISVLSELPINELSYAFQVQFGITPEDRENDPFDILNFLRVGVSTALVQEIKEHWNSQEAMQGTFRLFIAELENLSAKIITEPARANNFISWCVRYHDRSSQPQLMNWIHLWELLSEFAVFCINPSDELISSNEMNLLERFVLEYPSLLNILDRHLLENPTLEQLAALHNGTPHSPSSTSSTTFSDGGEFFEQFHLWRRAFAMRFENSAELTIVAEEESSFDRLKNACELSIGNSPLEDPSASAAQKISIQAIQRYRYTRLQGFQSYCAWQHFCSPDQFREWAIRRFYLICNQYKPDTSSNINKFPYSSFVRNDSEIEFNIENMTCVLNLLPKKVFHSNLKPALISIRNFLSYSDSEGLHFKEKLDFKPLGIANLVLVTNAVFESIFSRSFTEAWFDLESSPHDLRITTPKISPPKAALFAEALKTCWAVYREKAPLYIRMRLEKCKTNEFVLTTLRNFPEAAEIFNTLTGMPL